MEILVCVKRVPDTSENEIQLNSAGNDIERDDLVYSVNESDNYAVEEAFRSSTERRQGHGGYRGRRGGRRESCAGRWPWARTGRAALRRAFEGSDGLGIATILKAFVQRTTT